MVDAVPMTGQPAAAGGSPRDRAALAPGPALPLEIRVHGRGGQGGVTCAKLLATLYADLGLYVQTFGDYGMERSGAPVRAFTRVDAAPIANRNKVYAPHHLLVLDPTLLGEAVLEGATPGGLLLLNTPAPLASFAGRLGPSASPPSTPGASPAATASARARWSS